MSKKQWGKATWYLFHTLAEKLKPEFDNPTEIKALYAQIKKICYNLPCPDCTQHSTALLASVNEHAVTDSKLAFKHFLWQFHNKVNRTTGTPPIAFEEANAMYSRSMTRLIIQNFIDVMNIKSPDLKITMLQTNSKNAYMPGFTDYINKNIYKFN
jgi:hypothetical protein